MSQPFPVSLVLLPGYSMLALGAVRSVFAVANELSGAPAYQVRQYGCRESVPALCGLTMDVEPLAALAPLTAGLVLLLADERVDDSVSAEVGGHLSRLVSTTGNDGIWLGAVGAAAHVLASQGFLDGYRASIYWQLLGDAVQRFPCTAFNTNLYEMDRQRLSCGGGLSAIDMLLAWMAGRHGPGFVPELAAGLGVERLRAADERQPMPSSAQPAVGSARIKEAMELMESNLAEPLQSDDIARLVGVSRRQLERLFRQHLDALPSRYYLELRLKHARRQLRQTTQSILQVGLSCGFASGAHFSTAYRNYFGYTPREERARRAMPTASSAASGDNDL